MEVFGDKRSPGRDAGRYNAGRSAYDERNASQYIFSKIICEIMFAVDE